MRLHCFHSQKKANDPTRFTNRGGNLLKEEKQRSELQKHLPKVKYRGDNLLIISLTTEVFFLVLIVFSASWSLRRNWNQRLTHGKLNKEVSFWWMDRSSCSMWRSSGRCTASRRRGRSRNGSGLPLCVWASPLFLWETIFNHSPFFF